MINTQNVLDTLVGYADGDIPIPAMVDDYMDGSDYANEDNPCGNAIEADYAAAKEFG